MRVLKIAAHYGGVAYGGYVRDVITKVMVNDLSSVEIKDLDIWFKTEGDRQNFITAVGNRLRLTDKICSFSNAVAYGLYDAIFKDHVIDVDLVVSASFPVDDLDVYLRD